MKDTKSSLIKKMLADPKFRFGSYAALLSFLVLAGLVFINFMITTIPAEWDLTENQRYSLSQQTRAIISSLDKKIKVYALYIRNQEPWRDHKFLEKFCAQSEFLDLIIINPEKNPQLSQQYDRGQNGLPANSIILDSGEKFRVIRPKDIHKTYQEMKIEETIIEEQLVRALLYLTAEYTPLVYELEGLGGTSLRGDLDMQSFIQQDNYDLRGLDLMAENQVPKDASALIICDPRRDITNAERDKILQYLRNDGKAIFLLDYYKGKTPNLNLILGEYGMFLAQGVVFEAEKNYNTGSQWELLPILKRHEIIDPLRGRYKIVMPIARPLLLAKERRESLDMKILLSTSDEAWIREDVDGDKMLEKRLPTEKARTVPLAWAVIDKKIDVREDTCRVVAIGSAGLLKPLEYGSSKRHFDGNVEFFLNSLAWVMDRKTQQGDLGIRPKSLLRFNMVMSTLQKILYAGLISFFIPGVILVLGLVIWLRRRHL